MLTIPEEVLSDLKRGGFTVSILGRPCHSIAVDKAHEMCECKEYVTRPSADYINRTALFLPIRAQAMKSNCFQSKKLKRLQVYYYSTESESKKFEGNI